MNFDPQLPNLGPYTSSISSSASSSSSSVFSVEAASSHALSSSSSSTNSINISWDADEAWSCANQQRKVAPTSQANGWNLCSEATVCPSSLVRSEPFAPQRQPHALKHKLSIRTDVPVPPEQRRHPRRCSAANQRPPPPLVRQSERKGNFVDSLVDSATQMVEVIWPLSVPTSRCEGASGRGVLPLRTFIQETLRRSRTSYSTLQVALYYLILIKSHVPKHDFTMEQPADMQSLRALQCGRRMFLAALILASKYLQDRNYSAKAWSKISGLAIYEINANEIAFLQAVNWKLHIRDSVWERWQEIVLRCTPSAHPPPSPGPSPIASSSMCSWKAAIPLLTPELDTVEITPRTPLRVHRSDLRLLNRSPLSACDPPRSRDATPVPFKLPRFLEPRPDMVPPTPTLNRMGPLPTPQLTPLSATATTPAAGATMVFGSRRPSMCMAIGQAQNVSLARIALDSWNPAPRCNGLEPYSLGRRPSLAPSTSSLSSSPESMISDNSNSSRSSRASSISSVSSSAWAPNQAKLARLATCRNAGLPYPVPQKQQEYNEFAIVSEPLSSPDLENFHLDESAPQTAIPLPLSTKSDLSDACPAFPGSLPRDAELTPSPIRRKRGRSSADLSLQDEVKHLLSLSRQPSFERTEGTFDYASMSNICNSVLPDPDVAQSFMLDGSLTPSNYGTKAMQSPVRPIRDCRIPVQKDLGRKRACCATEAADIFPRHGPGMWEGIL